jgi:type IV pilus assembly protein PilM
VRPKAGAPTKAPVRARPSGGAFVGLDIGTHNIKAVEVKGAGAGLTVTALASVNTPPGVIQNGLVADPKGLGAAIKQLLSKNGLRAGRVVTAATGPDAVVVRVIEVPRMTPSELAETMKWEIERHIPFAANDVEMSYQAIDDPAALAADPNNPNMEVLLAVARRDMVGLHLDTLTAAGLRPVAIDIEALAVGRALIDLSGRGLATKNVVVVNIGASNTEVSIFKGGILRFPREIPLAGDNITRAIADHLGLSMEAAEDEKRLNAGVLMEVLTSGGGAADPFAAQSAGGAGSPFDFTFDSAPIPPPLFGGGEPTTPAAADVPPPSPFDTPGAAPTAPVSDDPFASASTFDPFGNTAGGGGGSDVPPVPPTGGGGAPVPAPDDPQYRRRREIFDAILPVLNELSMEIRRSVDYFRSRYPNDTIDQIILCGGSAKLRDLDQYVQYDMGIPTVVADPFAGVKLASKQMSAERLAELAPAFTVALGLATRDAVIGS